MYIYIHLQPIKIKIEPVFNIQEANLCYLLSMEWVLKRSESVHSDVGRAPAAIKWREERKLRNL